MSYELNDYQKGMYEGFVENKWGIKVGAKTTVVVIRLFNGFEITGSSACVNPNDYVYEIGEHFALVDALQQLDGFVGFMRQQEMSEQDEMTRMIEAEKQIYADNGGGIVASGSFQLEDLAFHDELPILQPTGLSSDFVEAIVKSLETHMVNDRTVNITINVEDGNKVKAQDIANQISEALRKKGV